MKTKANKKYRINEFLYRLSKIEYDIARKELLLILDICKRTFDRWRAYPQTSKSSIPFEKIVLIARFFGIEPTELLSDKTRKELDKIQTSNSLEDIAKSLNLSK